MRASDEYVAPLIASTFIFAAVSGSFPMYADSSLFALENIPGDSLLGNVSILVILFLLMYIFSGVVPPYPPHLCGYGCGVHYGRAVLLADCSLVLCGGCETYCRRQTYQHGSRCIDGSLHSVTVFLCHCVQVSVRVSCCRKYVKTSRQAAATSLSACRLCLFVWMLLHKVCDEILAFALQHVYHRNLNHGVACGLLAH